MVAICYDEYFQQLKCKLQINVKMAMHDGVSKLQAQEGRFISDSIPFI
jgi:hypothetical protein